MNPYENLNNPANIGNALMQGFQQGRQQRSEQETRNALSKYAQAQLMPGDQTTAATQEAMRSLAQWNPQLAVELQQREQARSLKALEAKRDQIKLGAQIIGALKPQDEAGWQRALQVAGQAGIDLSEVPQQFNPEYVQGLMAINQALNPEKNNAPSSVEEYEFARGQGFTGSYMDFLESKRGPIVANNGDGTFTIIPRGMGGPQQQAGGVPPLPPGFVIDNDGGQSDSTPTGGF